MRNPSRSWQPATTASPAVLGLDIGGANIKAATSDGRAVSVPFAMWLHPQDLAQQLVQLASGLPGCRRWAVTMTGEMADVFYDRAVGVAALVEQALQAAGQCGIDAVAFYSVAGTFVDSAAAIAAPDAVASANWHALAGWVAARVESPALLIDIGGTTTDIIAIEPGSVVTASRSDFDRLASGELVYLGGRRTPVCALVNSLTLAGRQLPLMREVFANTDDCALVLGLVAEDAEDRSTCDGGPRTVAAAANRLARMIGLDHRQVDVTAARELAREVIAAAAEQVAVAIACREDRYRGQWIVSGHTADCFLPALLAAGGHPRIRRLADLIGAPLSRVAPAFACAQLLAEQQEATSHSSGQAPRAVATADGTRSVPATLGPAGTETVPATAERWVVKLGGSLLLRPDLPDVLRRWLNTHASQRQVNLVVGGGALVDALRELDQVHRLDAASLHWQCVRLLRHTLEIVAAWLPEAVVIDSPAAFEQHRDQRRAGWFLIAPEAFYHPASGDDLPCDWTTTSDSIAALLAIKLAAEQLVLLKSCELPQTLDLVVAANEGIIDPVLPRLIAEPAKVQVITLG